MTILNRLNSSIPKALKTLTGIAILGMAAVTGAMNAGASAPQFNNLDHDFPTLKVAKEGASSWGSSVTDAKQGDVIDLMLWDHNTVLNSTALNVRLSINLDTTVASTHTATGSVSADNAQTVSLSNSIQTSSATKLEYIPGSAVFYKTLLNAAGTYDLVTDAFPNGVTPDSIVHGGIVIGNQAGCWEHAHAVMIRVRVEGGTASINTRKEVQRDGSDQIAGTTANAQPGDVLDYQIYFDNNGTATGRNPKIVDTLDARLSFVPGSAYLLVKQNNADRKIPVPDSYIKFEGQKMTFSFDDMAPGETSALYLDFSTKVADASHFAVGQTNIQNCAIASFETVSANTNCVTAIITKQAASTVSFSLRKEVTTNQQIWYDDTLGGAAAGDTVYYRLTMQNTGNTPAQNVTVKDILPAGITYGGSATLNGKSVDASSLVAGGYTFTNVTAGTSGMQVLIFQAKVSTICSQNGTLSNLGQVIWQGKVQAQDTADLLFSCQHTLIIQKDVKVDGSTGSYVDNAGTVTGNQKLDYRITVLNNGSTTVVHPLLHDALPKNVTYVPGTLKIDGEKQDAAVEQAFLNQGFLLTDLVPGMGKNVTFQATVAACPVSGTIVNTAYVKGDNTIEVHDTATVSADCTKPVSTPSAKPTSKPELPHTGGNDILLGLGALPALGLSVRHALARKSLSKAAKNIDII
jgi:uncharacterized repeat protein (TIGR01451 family)